MNLPADIKLPEDKPETVDDYVAVVEDRLKIDLTAVEATRYEDVTRAAKEGIENSEFWTSFRNIYRTLEDQYKAQKGYDLFTIAPQEEIVIKPYTSMLGKSYRKNVINNDNYPAAPDDGWSVPPNWFSTTNDIVRTSVVVKYLDGVDFLVDYLETLAKDSECNFRSDFEARMEGYYAAQTYIGIECEVPSETFDTEITNFSFEVEITTQLQDVIKRLLHHHYEKRRLAISDDNVSKPWQWDYRSEEFAVNYLGHILHYLEGMIMEARIKQGLGEGE